ncbi:MULTISPECIES: LysR family transcriptional regulator [unclassified Pseudomonas]|uniref:LysR family transcriptional regulator n=1 Tax=unclassified Pseudomonas TaxID=196821 RepID=UPI00380D334F
MITLKQIEAIYWIVELGSFEAAAAKLNMSQSAISKRVQELEDAFGVSIFDRSKRSARLTQKGLELHGCAVEMLRQRDDLLERVSSKETLVRRFRLGVTELTALTWLPTLVEQIHQTYPKVDLEPSIELSTDLLGRLEADELDLIIVPDIVRDPRFISTPLAAVENAWMCSPSLYPGNAPMSLQSLSSFTVLTQGGSSGTGQTYERWLAEHDVRLTRTLTSNYLVAQVGLAISGVGLSYLPRQCMRTLIEQGRLKIIQTDFPLPQISYVCVHRADRYQGLSNEVARLAQRACDFTRLIIT